MTIGNDSDSFVAARPAPDDASTQGATERAKQAAGTAAEEGQHVAGVAASEAGHVADEAKSHVRQLVGEATSQVEDQSRTQKDRLVGSLHTFSDDLEQMSSDRSGGLAAELVQEVAQRARALSANLEGREPRELVDDLRRYARRKPGTFLLGALAAGVVVGRLTRGAKAAQSSQTAAPTPRPQAQPPVSGDGVPVSIPLADPETSDPLVEPLPADAFRIDSPSAGRP
ncbi:hypothetical protein NOCA2480022 [metagenome]|uniref:Uncharacterized protein n=1 Tax=metagenome TaxID=256318 RepID=A0A2P2C7H9_9ZZZZ